MRLARAALHDWEEPPVSGWRGSGTVFFSGCTLHCSYCQNFEIANGQVGREVSVERLAEIFLEQQARGAHNINLVTPTHFVPQILEALRLARAGGLALPVVYNTSGYERAEVIEQLAGYVDIFLTDFKYASGRLAAALSHAPNYPEEASRALDAMFALVGPYTLRADGSELLERGIIVRHLLLPGCLADSLKVIDLLAAKPYASEIKLSLMNQFTLIAAHNAEHLRATLGTLEVADDEYETLIAHAEARGFEDFFIQEGGAAEESFIPNFNYEGV